MELIKFDLAPGLDRQAVLDAAAMLNLRVVNGTDRRFDVVVAGVNELIQFAFLTQRRRADLQEGA